MRKIILVTLIVCITVLSAFTAFASDMTDADADEGRLTLTSLDPDSIAAESAILIEANTGRVLFEKNVSEALPPASVTKVMTLLLVCEAIEAGSFTLDSKVMISRNAASMGGSQVFLEEGEEFTVEELLKCTVIASANDAAVALAELTAGSEEAFVDRMNDRAKELGLTKTHFQNTTGLDDELTDHLTSAYDIAIMSRELIKHDIILKYSGIWQDSIRDGEFILTNTNRLVRYYSGCTGLKTGYTEKAGFCISATAERDGMHLIAVIMGAESRDSRNDAARTLFDWGFANFSIYRDDEAYLENVNVLRCNTAATSLYVKEYIYLCEKGNKSRIEKVYDIPETVKAPLAENEVVGKVKYYLDDKQIGESDIYVKEELEEISRLGLFLKILSAPFD